MPAATAAAGFVGGYWMHTEDHRAGVSVELFDRLANAQAEVAQRNVDMPDESPVTIDSAGIVASA